MRYINKVSQQSFSNLLQASPELSSFVDKISQLEKINQILASKLEPELFANCQVANLRDGTLILTTTSPAWNHKLRFCSVDLLSALRSEPQWAGLKSIEVRVDYLPQTPNDTTTSSKNPVVISEQAAAALRGAAKSVSNSKLSKALEGLAARDT